MRGTKTNGTQNDARLAGHAAPAVAASRHASRVRPQPAVPHELFCQFADHRAVFTRRSGFDVRNEVHVDLIAAGEPFRTRCGLALRVGGEMPVGR